MDSRAIEDTGSVDLELVEYNRGRVLALLPDLSFAEQSEWQHHSLKESCSIISFGEKTGFYLGHNEFWSTSN